MAADGCGKSDILSRMRTLNAIKNEMKLKKKVVDPLGLEQGTFGMQNQGLTTELVVHIENHRQNKRIDSS